MKKTIILLTIAAMVGVGSYVVFAKEHMGGMMGGGMQGRSMMDSNDMMMQTQMMGSGMTGGYGMHPISGMMCGSSLVATEDGGVVVLMGNKLIKYDKDLSLVKEVEIKIDWENWKKMMGQQRDMMMQYHKMMTTGQKSTK